MSSGDEVLLSRVAAGDRQAVQDLYAAYADPLFRYALVRVRDRQLAEDIVQETMIAAWRSAETFRGGSSVSTWLFGICRHKLLDALRRRRGSEAGGLIEPRAEGTDGATDAEFWDRFHRLDDGDAELLLLVFHYGFAQREVAETMGIPVGTVKSRTFYARRKLQELLEGDQ